MTQPIPLRPRSHTPEVDERTPAQRDADRQLRDERRALLEQVRDDDSLTRTDIRVHKVLADYVNRERFRLTGKAQSWPSNETIAVLAKCDRSSVQRAVKRLVARRHWRMVNAGGSSFGKSRRSDPETRVLEWIVDTSAEHAARDGLTGGKPATRGRLATGGKPAAPRVANLPPESRLTESNLETEDDDDAGAREMSSPVEIRSPDQPPRDLFETVRVTARDPLADALAAALAPLTDNGRLPANNIAPVVGEVRRRLQLAQDVTADELVAVVAEVARKAPGHVGNPRSYFSRSIDNWLAERSPPDATPRPHDQHQPSTQGGQHGRRQKTAHGATYLAAAGLLGIRPPEDR